MSAKEIDRFLRLVNKADWATLSMSRKDCHAKNVSSIVVANRDGRLVRAFLATPGHSLWKNDIERGEILTCGVHDHRYKIGLYGICGDAQNIIFDYGTKWLMYRYQFSSAISGDGTAVKMPMVFLDKVNSVRIGPHLQTLEADVLHTVSVPKGERAAWWVHEGTTLKEKTTLLTNATSIDIKGLYHKFKSKDELLSHVEQFFAYPKVDISHIPRL